MKELGQARLDRIYHLIELRKELINTFNNLHITDDMTELYQEFEDFFNKLILAEVQRVSYELTESKELFIKVPLRKFTLENSYEPIEPEQLPLKCLKQVTKSLEQWVELVNVIVSVDQ